MSHSQSWCVEKSIEFLEKDAKSTSGKYSLEAMREKSGRLAISRGLKIFFGSGWTIPHGS